MCASPASPPSPCATSMSAACAVGHAREPSTSPAKAPRAFIFRFDMDSVDPEEAPGVGTPVRGGITYREAHLAMETICDIGTMVSMEVVEVNPVIDKANRTALLGVELVMSAMGKRIL